MKTRYLAVALLSTLANPAFAEITVNPTLLLGAPEPGMPIGGSAPNAFAPDVAQAANNIGKSPSDFAPVDRSGTENLDNLAPAADGKASGEQSASVEDAANDRLRELGLSSQ